MKFARPYKTTQSSQTLLAFALLLACGAEPRQVSDSGDGSEDDSTVTADGSSASDTGPTSAGTDPTDGEGTSDTSDQPTNQKLDILLIVDNSGSMGEEQAILADGLGELFAVLENPSNEIDWRLGVTTSDNGNPWCGATSPESGSLTYSSCLGRLGTFVNQAGDVDVRSIACSDRCSHDDFALGISATSPPWLEPSAVPDGLTATEMASCLVPQGINGCGFESQLENGRLALLKSESEEHPEFGFMRLDANLLIVVLTDEADCSYNSEWASIFLQSGNKVFWDSPTDAFPTSAVCWNAGTECTDIGGGEFDCQPQNHDVDGNPLTPGDPAEMQAVLYPMARYHSQLESVRAGKQTLNPSARVGYALIAGFGTDGTASYSASTDPTFQTDFGIGAGCSSDVDGATPCVTDPDCQGIGIQSCSENGYCLESQTAIPPVRQFDLAKGFPVGANASICEGDFGARIAEMVADISDL